LPELKRLFSHLNTGKLQFSSCYQIVRYGFVPVLSQANVVTLSLLVLYDNGSL
jgi:hypothetical protein